MSRHHVQSEFDSHPVVVVAGYDRPTKEFFLQVLPDDGDTEGEEVVLYSSLHEPQRDWRDPDTLHVVVAELRLSLPPGMLDAVSNDRASNTGNRIVVHHFDQPPEVLLAG
ncbi:hypothetical protein [Sphaerotilus sp.]|uniref:hypothetical protein n=1 Tax=Sphaerotilus sp. TaxID=2093942 RepID=UPI002ACD53B7|nr:hypothetical protein [Sphaerotilus sp.]MDZ7855761.1 hypothetical protein [Sphaerotilus sp.]